MSKTIRDRFELLLAKIAGRDVNIKAMRPAIPADIKEELMLDIADRIDKIERMNCGTSSIDDFADVDIHNIMDGQTITYNSKKEKWVNTDIPVPTTPRISEISDVDITDPHDGQVIVFDKKTNRWRNASTNNSWSVYTVTRGAGYCTIDNIQDNGITGVAIKIITDGATVPKAINANVIISKSDDSISIPLRADVVNGLTSEEVVAEFIYRKDSNIWTGQCTNGYNANGDLSDRKCSDICIGNYIISNDISNLLLTDYSDYSISEINVSLDSDFDLGFDVQVLTK